MQFIPRQLFPLLAVFLFLAALIPIEIHAQGRSLQDLGDLTNVATEASARTVRDSVDSRTNQNDWYRFNVTQAVRLNLVLDELSGDADLCLYDRSVPIDDIDERGSQCISGSSDPGFLASDTAAGTTVDTVEWPLQQGTYYIRVDAFHSDVTITYRLRAWTMKEANVSPSVTTLTIVEGESRSYAVKLDQAPSRDVRVTLASDNDGVTVRPESLSFTPNNWNTDQMVTVEAAEDDDFDDDSAEITHGLEGFLGDAAVVVTVTVTDNDMPGVTLSPTTLAMAEGGSATYSVSLDTAPAGDVTVTATSSSPDDITVSPATLTFTAANWNTPQRVTVNAREDDDAADDTVTLAHAVTGYGEVTDGGSITVTVTDNDTTGDEEEKKAVTQVVADIAAVALSNVTANIGTRFSAPTGSTGIALAPSGAFGQKPAPSFVPATTDLHGISDTDSPLKGTSDARTRTLTLDDLLRSGAFQIALGASEGGTPEAGMGTTPQWTVWGRGDLQFFESKPERGSTYDGDLKAGYLGIDSQLGDQWLAGLAVSRTRTEADYGMAGSGAGEDGRLEVTLNSLHPYLRFAPDARSELWTILGAGRGEIENARGGASPREKSDVEMWMVSAGGRRAMDPAGEMDWALLGDAGFARVETDDGALTIQGITVDSWRIRLGVEGSHTSELEGGQTLTTFAEVAGRVDGGDGGEEVGLEVSPGVYLSAPASGFGIEARGRVLALSSADDYKEYGASVTASFSPRPDGMGLSMSVSPRWGAGSASGADTLWREEGIGSTGTGSADSRALSLNTRMSYGVATLRGALAPFGELDLREQGRQRVRMGARFTPRRSEPEALSLEVSGERYENGGADPDHRVSITGRLRF